MFAKLKLGMFGVAAPNREWTAAGKRVALGRARTFGF
jgi:hypothetical protein